MNVKLAIPLLIQEGWTRHQEEVAKPPLTERTGWSRMEPLLKNAFRNTPSIPTTPSAPLAKRKRDSAQHLINDASHLFLDGAATPPVSGGELPARQSFTPSMTARAFTCNRIKSMQDGNATDPYRIFFPLGI